jgi:uncharacterized membrane protein YhaH (DUF805 family)
MIRVLLKSLLHAIGISILAFGVAWIAIHFSPNHEQGPGAWLAFLALFPANVIARFLSSVMAFPPTHLFPSLLIAFWFLVMLTFHGRASWLDHRRKSRPPQPPTKT